MRTQTYLASLAIVMLAPVLVMADWASDMFKDTSHNFGMVARGADTRFSFVFTNKYKEDVVIESVQSTCRCTQPSFQKRVIKTWETGQIDIQLDTRNFYGRKDATVTVRFSRPFYAEVQLHSFCFIRTDVYVEPGTVAFGTVPQGQTRTASFRVNYAGRTYWQSWGIRDIQSESSFYKANLKLVQRDYNYVSYDITLTLKENAPEGYLNDFIDIISNDPNPSNQHCPVPVSAYIIPSVTVKPSPLAFGSIKAGKEVTKTVVLSGQRPFKITAFGTSDDRVSVDIKDEVKSVHVVPVTIKNDGKGGKISGKMAFRTSAQPNNINLPFFAELESGPVAEPPAIQPAPITSDRMPLLTPGVQTADDVPVISKPRSVPSQQLPKPGLQEIKKNSLVTPQPSESEPVQEKAIENAPAVEEQASPSQPRELTPAEEYFPPNTGKDSDDVPEKSDPAPDENDAQADAQAVPLENVDNEAADNADEVPLPPAEGEDVDNANKAPKVPPKEIEAPPMEDIELPSDDSY